MNPNSNYYLAFNTGYPNAFDRAWGRTGSELMVHGDCSSRGCYAMTDEQIQEIYALARDSFFGGQKEFQFQAYPFRMTALNMAKHRNNPNFAFWKMLKEGYDHFEVTHQEPKVDVCEKRYVFDAAPPRRRHAAAAFNPRGKCPVYRLDRPIAARRSISAGTSRSQMAELIASGVDTGADQHGADGGMNPVFASKLASRNIFDNNGHSYSVAGNSAAPGMLPRTPSQPPSPPPEASHAIPAARHEPAGGDGERADASPGAAAERRPRAGEKPTSIAGLLGNLFTVRMPKPRRLHRRRRPSLRPCAPAPPKWRRSRNANPGAHRG